MKEKRKSQFGENENYVSTKSMVGYNGTMDMKGYNSTYGYEGYEW